MDGAGRCHSTGDLRASRGAPAAGRRAGPGGSGLSPRRLAASPGSQGRRARDRQAPRQPPHLRGRPGRPGGAPHAAGSVLEQGPGELQSDRRAIGGGGRMTTQAQQSSIQTEILVDAPVDRAFRVFTEQFDKIKPRDHNMLAVDIAESVFEPQAGGRVYDRGVDGTECQWARVLAYEPPERIVFTWDISPQWQLESDLDRASEVEVRFVAESPERTRVELEHRHLDRHGEGWEGLREGVGGDNGWPLYLERFAEQVAAVE